MIAVMGIMMDCGLPVIIRVPMLLLFLSCLVFDNHTCLHSVAITPAAYGIQGCPMASRRDHNFFRFFGPSRRLHRFAEISYKEINATGFMHLPTTTHLSFPFPFSHIEVFLSVPLPFLNTQSFFYRPRPLDF